MRIPITAEMRAALERHLRRQRISVYDLGADIGVDPSTLTRFRRTSKSITSDNWDKLEPKLRDDLEATRGLAAKSLSPTGNLATAGAVFAAASHKNQPAPTQPNKSQTIRVIEPSELVRTPVISLARASGYHQAVHNASSFVEEMGEDFEIWDEVPAGHMLIRIEGNSMSPVLSDGAVVEVNTKVPPRRGDMVVALLSCEEYPVVKYYDRKKGKVRLQAVNPDPDEGRSYLINLYDRAGDQIHWMWPVVRIQTSPPRADEIDWGDED